jgi:hypothetical protein
LQSFHISGSLNFYARKVVLIDKIKEVVFSQLFPCVRLFYDDFFLTELKVELSLVP